MKQGRIGFIGDNDPNTYQLRYQRRPFVLEITPSGTIVWKKFYGPIGRSGTIRAVTKQNDFFYFSGYKYEYNLSYLNLQGLSLPGADAFVTKINSNPSPSALFTTYVSGTSRLMDIAYDIEIKSNGTILLPVVYNCNDCYGFSGTAEGRIYYINSSNGSIVNFSSIGTIKATDLKIGVTNTSDGGFAVVSTKQVTPPPSNPQFPFTPPGTVYQTTYWNTDAYVAKFDPSASKVWETTFDNNSPVSTQYMEDVKRQECLYDIVETPDHGLIISGNNSYNYDDDYLVKLYSDCNATYPYSYVATPANNIFINTTWSTSKSVKGMIVIPSGVKLTITGANTVIEFADSKRTNVKTGILIMPGGRLEIINGAKLTALQACEGSMWDGVIVKGNANAAQSPTSNQGFLYMRSGGTIQYARAAVRLYDVNADGSPNMATTGGIINARNAKFMDNYQSVCFLNYPFLQVSNQPNYNSLLFDCEFTNAGLMRDPEYVNNENKRTGIKNFISIQGIIGLTLQGNLYQTNHVGLSLNGTGIEGYLASYRVYSSTFRGLSYGINSGSTQALSHQVIIGNNTFDNVRKGITNLYQSNDWVYGNTFNIPLIELELIKGKFWTWNDTWGVKMEGVLGLSMNNNKYGPYPVQSGSSRPAYGSIIRNSGAAGGVVERDSYHDIFYGTQTEENNPNLSLKCNDYTNHQYAWSINPESSGGTLKNQGEGPQSTDKQAGNLFFDFCTDSERHIRSTIPFIYYAAANAPVGCHSPIVTVSNSTNSNDISCPPPDTSSSCGGDLSTCLVAMQEQAKAEKEIWKRQQYLNAWFRLALQQDKLSEAITFMEQNRALFADPKEADRQLISTYIDCSELEKARTALIKYQVDNEEDRDFVTISDLFLKARSERRSLYELTESEWKQVDQLAEHTTVAALAAQNLLHFIKGIPMDDAPERWDKKGEHKRVETQRIANNTIDKTAFKLYPNPTSSSFTLLLSLEEVGADTRLEITDLFGRVLHEEGIPTSEWTKELDVSLWSGGMYFVRIISGSKRVQTEKLMIIK